MYEYFYKCPFEWIAFNVEYIFLCYERPIVLRVVGNLRQRVLVMVWVMLSLMRMVLLLMVGVLHCCVLLEHWL